MSTWVKGIALVLLAGCASKNGKMDSLESSKALERHIKETPLDDEGLVLVEIDLNMDDTPDVENTYRQREDKSRLLLKKRTDLNFDGEYDVITEFDEVGAIKTEFTDSDFDGRLDRVDHYQDNLRMKSEIDTNYDGQPDLFFFYLRTEEGATRIDRKERDTNFDGQIDFWEQFDGDGMVVTTARDLDGDGRMDVRDE